MNRIVKNSKKFSISEIAKMLDRNTKNVVKGVFAWIEYETEVVDKQGNMIEGVELRAKEGGKNLQYYLERENKRTEEIKGLR